MSSRSFPNVDCRSYPDLSVHRVLIFRVGSLGDTVAALPCFHLIARSFPNAERVLLADVHAYANATAAKAVLDGSGLVHGYMDYPGATKNPLALFRLLLRIRAFQPDVLVYLMPVRSPRAVRRDRWFFRLAGIGRLIGLPGESESAHRKDPHTGLYESETSRMARCLKELGDAEPERFSASGLCLTAEEQKKATDLLSTLAGRPLFICGPGSKMQAKDWGAENWCNLLHRLHANHSDFGLVMVGAANEYDTCESIASSWPGPRINISGKTTPRETAAVLRHATVFLGPDSGPKHLAASVGVPSVCVFSARDLPGVWFPPGQQNIVLWRATDCSGCMLETCIEQKKKCILSITVDEVEAAVESVLARQSGLQTSSAPHLALDAHPR